MKHVHTYLISKTDSNVCKMQLFAFYTIFFANRHFYITVFYLRQDLKPP